MITEIGIFQICFYLFILFLLVKPLGRYMAKIYEGKPFFIKRWGEPLELLFYRLCCINPKQNMDWKQYLFSMLLFNCIGLIALYAMFRLQDLLFLNPLHLKALEPTLSFNTAISFVSNTNWQAYSGETTMSYFTQMLALTSQNFLSAATGMSLLMALCRGIKGHETQNLGNFWVDTTQSILYILLPLSFVFALILVSQGVIQNLNSNLSVKLIQPISYQNKPLTEQIIPMGPVASQVAIKQLGTNGGGFFNANSAHPFENPTPLTNFLEMLALVLIPAALCYTFGLMVHDKRQGWAVLAAMICLFIPFIVLAVISEQAGNPALTAMQVASHPAHGYPGGNMEGKESRNGIIGSALWAVATTAASNGSVNSMHDSYTPLGGLATLLLMQFGEVVFGGVGSGLYGLLMLVIIAVFVAGLMVGRTPEYLGKKIEPFEMKMASIAVLFMPVVVLLATALASTTSSGVQAISNPGIHGFSEMLYAFTSQGNNNGSAFAGLNGNTPFYNVMGGVLMLISRYWIAIPVIAIAGSLARKKIIPQSSGTLATHTPLFIIILINVTVLIGALSFLPALALGPIIEHIHLWETYGH